MQWSDHYHPSWWYFIIWAVKTHVNNLASGYCSKSILNLRQHLELRSFSVFTVIFMPRVPSRNQFMVLIFKYLRICESWCLYLLPLYSLVALMIIFLSKSQALKWKIKNDDSWNMTHMNSFIWDSVLYLNFFFVFKSAAIKSFPLNDSTLPLYKVLLTNQNSLFQPIRGGRFQRIGRSFKEP